MFARYVSAILLVLAMGHAPAAWAQVAIAFYSHELGSTFPHAFITMKGSLESNGAPVDAAYGFTAKRVSPAVLMGDVYGEVEIPKPSYVASSDRQIALNISDAQYEAVLAIVKTWRDRPGKSYNLNRRNCIHFVGEIAAAVGLKINVDSEFFKKPRSYLREILALNPALAALLP